MHQLARNGSNARATYIDLFPLCPDFPLAHLAVAGNAEQQGFIGQPLLLAACEQPPAPVTHTRHSHAPLSKQQTNQQTSRALSFSKWQ